ncbi:hypothetical protein BC832DRAFT_59158 [Gaertneriomyces semiglobifer]|nr:hypothetical protein BC832DRAFT_59158 [Gaertneriomyces semiglobifer]
MADAFSDVRGLIFDYDGTITVEDTTPVIAATARPPPACPPWNYFVDTYLDDYNKLKQQLANATDLNAYLNGFRSAEETSIRRVEDAQALLNSTKQNLRDAGMTVPTKPGWTTVAHQWLETHPADSLFISSVNWSSDLISGTLDAAGVHVDDENILCNDLEMDDRGVSTGKLIRRAITGPDKLEMLKKRLSVQDLSGYVYIGDSTYDLPCLLSASLGIFIAKPTSALPLADKYGFSISPLPPSKSITEKNGFQNRIYYVSDGWPQILSFFNS